ncbi:MAG TPA: VTT domain-containing protein [Steroidobacteraceae bacterium]|nr:VTT domain-containing protein [Steroidobacteraceae bacterium]
MKLEAALPRLLLVAGIVAAAAVLAHNRDRLDIGAIEQLTRHLGVWAPIGHVVLFAAGTVLFAPGAIFGLAGGVLFGPFVGTLLNLAGATLGATAAFLVARYIAADWVRARTGARIERLISGVEAEGWRFVALMRLVPLVPFNLLNYALGLTRISLPQYVLASLIAMAPGTLAYTWLGYAGRQALGGETAAIRYGLLALGLLAAIAFVPRLVSRLRSNTAHRWIEVSELARLLADKGGVAVVDVRSPDDFRGPLGHIAGARNLPLTDLQSRLAEIAALKNEPVVLVCRTHRMSATAAAQLGMVGFRDIRVVRGGMVQWNEQGLPIADRLEQRET